MNARSSHKPFEVRAESSILVLMRTSNRTRASKRVQDGRPVRALRLWTGETCTNTNGEDLLRTGLYSPLHGIVLSLGGVRARRKGGRFFHRRRMESGGKSLSSPPVDVAASEACSGRHRGQPFQELAWASGSALAIRWLITAAERLVRLLWNREGEKWAAVGFFLFIYIYIFCAQV